MLNRAASQTRREGQPSEIMSVLRLKMIANNNQNVPRGAFHQPGHSIINTPSTIEKAKKFKSCELYRKEDQSSCLKNKVENTVFSRPKISGSATRILTINEIRKQEDMRKQKGESKQRMASSSSRKKIFVSLSKKNSICIEKPKVENDLIPAHSLLADEAEMSTNQKLKINVYRNIAKSRNI